MAVLRNPKGSPLVVKTRWSEANDYTVVRGDCSKLLARIPTRSTKLIITSPPYCIGKSYEQNTRAEDFLPALEQILPDLIRILRLGGSLCWQVGYHVTSGVVVPLDMLIYEMMKKFPLMKLRNRIIWTFAHGLHSSDRFSGRHETLLWFTKGTRHKFDLDAVRVLQKYPGKRHYKGKHYGELSGNPKGKNPSDVWDSGVVWAFPIVKANHVEKTIHPCQFPVALAQRVIASTTSKGDLVMDPYAGSGTTGVAAALLSRRFVGAEIDIKYHQVAVQRIGKAINREVPHRPDWKPIYRPKPNTPLTSVPHTWKLNGTSGTSLVEGCPVELSRNGDHRSRKTTKSEAAIALNTNGR